MKLKKISDGMWWIVNLPPGVGIDGLPGIGPYNNRWDAEDAMEGMLRYDTFKPHEISCDSPLARRRTK